jgi:hypothetical protein
MHWFARLLIYLLILLGIPLFMPFIPKEESTLRTCFALTWFLWVLVGLALAVRGTWRFLASR